MLKLWLIVPLLCLLGVDAQTCVPYDRNQLVFPCNVQNPSSYALLQPGQNLSDMIFYTNIAVGGTIGLTGNNHPCLDWLGYFCQVQSPGSNIQPMSSCLTGVNDSNPIPMAAIPCHDFCVNLRDACLPVLTFYGLESLMPSTYCDPYTNNPQDVNGTLYPCWNISATYTDFNATCDLTDLPYMDPSTGLCFPRCPSPEYTESRLQDLGIMQQIVGWISFVLGLIMGVIMLASPVMRAFPTRMLIYLLISTFPLALAFMLPTFIGGNLGELLCDHQTHYPISKLFAGSSHDISDAGICAFQGWNIILGTLCSAFWWCLINIHTAGVFRKVTTELAKVPHTRHFTLEEGIYVFIGFGIPLILSIIAVAANQITYEPSTTYCFVSSADGEAWRIALWYVPIGIVLVIGTGAVFFSIALVINIWRKKSGSEKDIFLHFLIRQMMLSVLYWAAFVIVFASQINISVHLSDNRQHIIEFLTCLAGSGGAPFCREILDASTNLQSQIDLSQAATFFLAALGTFITIFILGNPAMWGVLKRSFSTYGSSSSFGGSNRASGFGSARGRTEI